MIIYKDILEHLKAAGYTTTKLRSEKILSESILTRIRNNKPLSTETLDKICNILKCDISDIIEHHSE